MATNTWVGAKIVKELLNKGNYPEWSVCMKSYLFAQDLWDVVEELWKMPNVVWKRKNAAAFHAILISCGTEAAGLVLDCSSAEDSASDAWYTLASTYNSGGEVAEVLLHKTNYKKWRVCMKRSLLAQDLWDVVKPSESESDKSSELNVWEEKNAKAFDAILLSCGREAKNLILDCSKAEDSARDAWDTLDSIYNSGGEVAEVFLHKTNYKKWRVCMKRSLLAQDLWDVVKPSESESDKSSELNVWEEKNAKAFHAILLSCGREAKNLILDCSKAEDSARDAWDTLDSIYNSGEVAEVLLHKTNYKKWRVCMKTSLLAQDLWDVVKPYESESDKSSELNVWEEKNAKAFDAILLSCGREAKNLILDCSKAEDSARDAWDTLDSIYNSGAAIVKELLNRENYKEWSVCMKKYLEGEDLWGVVETGNATPSISESDVNWKRKNDLAFHTIWISCGEEAADLSLDISSAKAAWDKLAEDYESLSNISADEPVRCTVSYDPQYQRLLYKAIRNGDWDTTEKIVKDQPATLTAKISAEDNTPLHAAVAFKHPHIVEGLVQLMKEKDLELKNSDGQTPLISACYYGTTEMAKCMVNKNKNLLTIPVSNSWLPVTVAVIMTNKEMARYLYSVTPFEVFLPKNSSYGAVLLFLCLTFESLDIALALLSGCPQLAITLNQEGGIFVEQLATMPSMFPSGCQFGFFQNWIYKCPMDRAISTFLNLFGINQIYETKLIHKLSQEFLRIICAQISTLNAKELKECRLFDAIIQAGQHGIHEFIVELVKEHPRLAWSCSDLYQNFFYSAIKYRQAKVFSMIYGYIWKDLAANTFNKDKCTMLHMAGMLAPQEQLNRISGAALQMQRELQWFKEVESIVPPGKKGIKNKGNVTAKDLFTMAHKDLVKEGEKWMKDTATSCTVVGALIVTIMFAVVFTVPGGNNQDTGYPIFKDESSFMVFIISDAISLFSSSTSVLIFLGILTSRYGEEDFLKSLPTKLIIGLSLLFISIATMMIAFCAALFIILKGKLWIIAPIIFLASVPICLFIKLQFPLLIEIYISTFGSGIFDRNCKALALR